jgi:hypothetical protein
LDVTHGWSRHSWALIRKLGSFINILANKSFNFIFIQEK